MRTTIAFLLFISSFSFTYSQNKYSNQMSKLYSEGKYDECFELCEKANFELGAKDKSETFLFKALCYYKFSKSELKSIEYPNPLKKSAKQLKRFMAKDKKGTYLSIHKDLVIDLRNNLYIKVNALENENKNAKATYIEKTLDYAFKKTNLETVPSSNNIAKTEEKTTTSKETTPSKKETEKLVEKSTQKNKPASSEKEDKTDNMIVFAKTKIGIPYQYGGMSDNGYDCSGFTATVFKQVGYQLPRVSKDQATKGKTVSLKDAQKGDLIFFHRRGNINHVGIVISEPGEELKMIHASTSKGIRIDAPINDPYWKDKIKFVKRYNL